MAKDPLRTKLCDMLGIEFPIVSFTHCKDVVVAVVNAGAFAVLGEALHTPEEIEADVKWIRERVDGKPFGIDLVLPASSPPSARPANCTPRSATARRSRFSWLPMPRRRRVSSRTASRSPVRASPTPPARWRCGRLTPA